MLARDGLYTDILHAEFSYLIMEKNRILSAVWYHLNYVRVQQKNVVASEPRHKPFFWPLYKDKQVEVIQESCPILQISSHTPSKNITQVQDKSKSMTVKHCLTFKFSKKLLYKNQNS